MPGQITNSELSNIVREKLKEQGLTLREGAKEIGISPPTLSRVQNGVCTPSIKTFACLSKWLGIPVDLLLPDSLLLKEYQLKFDF